MKIDNEKFIDVGKIVKYYGEDIILKLPHIQAVTGCDTNCVGKMVFKKRANSKEFKKLTYFQILVYLQLLMKKLLVKFQKLFKRCAALEWKMNQLQRQEREFTSS